ncbi:hypothetical protein [Streptomyces sp. NPDC000410]|uniref:hypothetical protein n=1 Tax=Streptomyces sp. NPDC000410 TaxID=3154254 RepID=UPI00331C1139
MQRRGTTRRRALMATGAAALATGLSGCSSDDPAVPRTASGAAFAETALRLRSAAASRALLARYDAVLLLHPGLAARLAPLRAAVALHVEALSPAAAASAAPSATPGEPARPRVSADALTAVGELATAERTTADAHTAELTGAPPEYARLLASVAAAGAAHAYLLAKPSKPAKDGARS